MSEWQLWDNCRRKSDRAYLHSLARSDPRCKVKQLPEADGSPGAIGSFFRFCDDPDALYLRLDDDIVFIEQGFFPKFVRKALAERGNAIWFSPLVINNAICNVLLKFLSQVVIVGPVTSQAMCPLSWAQPDLPEALHPVFVDAVRTGRLDAFRVPDRDIRSGRFSINALGFFGAEKIALGDLFLPPGYPAEEEWISAILPLKVDRPGRIFGDLLVAHFSFMTQERRLLQTDILDSYYRLAGFEVPPFRRPIDRVRLKDRLRPWRKRENPVLRLFEVQYASPQYSVSLDGAPGGGDGGVPSGR